jgi:hypothetical protein
LTREDNSIQHFIWVIPPFWFKKIQFLNNYDRHWNETQQTCSLSNGEPITTRQVTLVICISRVICSLISDTKKLSVQHPWAVLLFLVHLDQRSRWTIAITWRPSSVVCRL